MNEELIKKQIALRKFTRDQLVVHLSKVEDSVFADTTVEEITAGFFNTQYSVRDVEKKLGQDLVLSGENFDMWHSQEV